MSWLEDESRNIYCQNYEESREEIKQEGKFYRNKMYLMCWEEKMVNNLWKFSHRFCEIL